MGPHEPVRAYLLGQLELYIILKKHDVQVYCSHGYYQEKDPLQARPILRHYD